MKKSLLLIIMLFVMIGLLVSCSGESDKDNEDNSQTDNGADNGSGGDTDISGGDTVWSADVDTVVVVNDEQIFVLSTDLTSHLYKMTEKSPIVRGESQAGRHEIILGRIDGNAISSKAYKRLDEYADLEGLADLQQSAWLIYAEGGSLAVAYSDTYSKMEAINYIINNYKAQTFAPKGGVLAKNIFSISDKISDLRAEEQAADMENIGKLLGADALNSFKKLYGLFDEELYIWLANLWCPDNGGFYYSASARNNEGFLPDLESTGQALNTLVRSGLASAYEDEWAKMLPDSVKAKLLSFAKDMQAEDGYFYHPQWGTSVNRSRRGRDAGWARTIITNLGGKPNYPYISDTSVELSSLITRRLNSGSSVQAVSRVVAVAATDEIYATKESFIAYLDSLKFNENSYSAGNAINSTVSAIKKYGHWETLRQYLTEHQNPNNGLWEDEVSYQSVNGLMKLCTCFGSSFPNAEKALDSAIEILLTPLDDELTGITFVYNPWVAIANLLHAVSSEKAVELREMLYSNASAIFTQVATKLAAFAKEDGGFSYLRDYSSPFSQEALVAVSGSVESDVNATSIAISTVVLYMEEVFDIRFPMIYSKYESIYFLETLTSMGTIIKDTSLSEPPEVITFDDYLEEDAIIDGNVVISPIHGVTNTVGDTEAGDSGYKWFESSVVPNPSKGADPSDLVLYVADKVYKNEDGETEYASTQSSTTFDILNMGASGNCYIFEADILFDGTNDEGMPVMQIIYNRKGSSLNSAWVNIYQYERFGKKYLRIEENFAGVDGIKDKEVVAGLPVDSWFKLRIEMYKDYSGEGGSLMTKMKFFVNGKYAGYSDSGHYASGAYKDFLVNAVKLTYYRQAASAFYLNNVYVAKSSQVFKNEGIISGDTEETVGNKTVWDFEDGIPSQKENFTEMFYKDEENGKTSIDASLWTDDLNSVYEKKGGTKIYSFADPENPTNQVIKAYSYNSDSSNYKATMYIEDVLTVGGGKTWEVEFDYYYDKIGWLFASDFMSLEFQDSNGTSLAGITFEGLGWEDTNNTDILGIRLSNGKSLTNFALSDVTWYTFKLVYHHNEENPSESKLLIYVLTNDGYACIANETLAAKAGVVERVGFVFHSYKIRGNQYIDDVSVSRTDLEYANDKPIEGEIKIPEGADNKIYITDSQRGQGLYYTHSEKFDSVSYDMLVHNGTMALNQKRGDGIADGLRSLSIIKVDGSHALVYKTLGSGNHALNFVAEKPAYDGFVFEADVKLNDIDAEEGRDIRFTGTNSNGVEDSSLYAFNIKLHKNPKNSIGGYIITVAGSEEKVVVKDDSWFNIRLETDGLESGSLFILCINGKTVVSGKLNGSIAGIKGVELYTPSTYGGHGWEEGSVSLDNVYVSGKGTPPPYDTITDDGRGDGNYKTDAITYTGKTYESLVADGYMKVNAYRKDGIVDGKRSLTVREVDGDAVLSYAASGSGNHAINFTAVSAAVDGFVFETDLMLDGAFIDGTRDISFVGTATNGTAAANLWGFNIKIRSNPDDTIGGYIISVNGLDHEFYIADGAWVNIQFVAYGLAKGSDATFAVNSVEKVFKLSSSIASIKGVELYTASDSGGLKGFSKGTLNLDNTYVSGTGVYDAPDEITETSRGEGSYASSAIKYFSYLQYSDIVDDGLMIENNARGDGVSDGRRTVSLKDSNGVTALVYTSLGSGNHSLNFAAQSEAVSGFVFETDIKLENATAAETRPISFVGTSTNGINNADLWGVNIKIYPNPDSFVGGYILTVAGSDWKGVIPENTWINIGFEAVSLKKGGTFYLYVNGEMVTTGNLTNDISAIKGIELYTPSTHNGVQGFTSGSIYIDNTYVSGTGTPPDSGEDTDNSNGTMTGENIDDPAWDENH